MAEQKTDGEAAGEFLSTLQPSVGGIESLVVGCNSGIDRTCVG